MTEKLHEGTDVLVKWFHWSTCPSGVQRTVLAWIEKTQVYTAALHPAPMVMVHPADRQVRQDVCKAWREHLDDTFGCRVVVPFGDRSIVVWFNQMPAPLVEV